MPFCRSIYVTKVMELLAFIFEQPSYLRTMHPTLVYMYFGQQCDQGLQICCRLFFSHFCVRIDLPFPGLSGLLAIKLHHNYQITKYKSLIDMLIQ